MKYFAYGSNLSSKHLRQRCSSIYSVGKASLKDYELVFNFRSNTWSGGAAGVEPKPGSVVWGALYDISKDDLGRLDEFEGVKYGAYRRVDVIVEDNYRKKLNAITYKVVRKLDRELRPTKEYVDLIMKGAVEHKLPEQYTESLKLKISGLKR